LGINARNLDIAPQETARIHVLTTDTVRGIEINNPYIPSGMNWKYDPKSQLLLPTVDFRVLVDGIEGESIHIPISVPDAGFDSGFSVPGLQIPPLPILTIPPSLGQSIANYITQNANTPTLDYALASWDWPGIFGVWTTQNRGVSITQTSISVGSVYGFDVRFTTFQEGLYGVFANFQQLFEGGTAGTRCQRNIDLTFGSSSLDMFGTSSEGTYSSGGLATIEKTYAALIPLNAAQTITFRSSSSPLTGTSDTIKVSLFAIRLTIN